MSHDKGALYPWRTIAGDECSAYFPAGTAQYHINADIAYSIKMYMEATGDQEYLVKAGAEIVMETARIWTGIGSYDREAASASIR
jgi:alpha,alpha-trehalose phosphorylase